FGYNFFQVNAVLVQGKLLASLKHTFDAQCPTDPRPSCLSPGSQPGQCREDRGIVCAVFEKGAKFMACSTHISNDPCTDSQHPSDIRQIQATEALTYVNNLRRFFGNIPTM